MNNPLHEALAALFEESAALANRLKKNARLPHRNGELSPAGRGLLHMLHLNGSMTVPQLAAAHSTTRQSVQPLVHRLAAAGFIELVTNPQHKRSPILTLTAAGRALLASANERGAIVLDGLLPQTAPKKLREATELLRKLRCQLDGAPERETKTTAPAAVRSKRKPQRPARGTVQPGGTSADELPVNLL